MPQPRGAKFEICQPEVDKSRTCDRELSEIAERQHGRVSTEQLEALGLSREAIRKRKGAGRLHDTGWGVYAVGYPRDTPAARLMNAALSFPGAPVGRVSAAVHWNMLRFEPAEVHLLDPRRRQSRPGVVAHPVRKLDPRDVTTRDGIPITTPVRTLLDLAATANDRILRRAVGQALIDELVTEEELRREIQRRRGQRGVRRLRTLVATGTIRTRSGLEDVAVDLVRDHGLPKPECNVVVLGEEADLYWRDLGLILEIDGADYHENIVVRRKDAAKQAHWEANRLRVLRVSEEQVEADLGQCARRIANAIAERSRLMSA